MIDAIPATLTEAIASEPTWLRAWVMLLVVTHTVAAIAFIVGKESGGWRVRGEPIAIIVGFVAAGMLMNWMYAEYGYVRLLGLAHLIGWTPAYLWVLTRRKRIGVATLYGKYIHAYLLIASVSLVIDTIDVIRYLLGDAELFMRWS